MRIQHEYRKFFPEVEYIAGVGFCGPQWREAEAMYYGNLAVVAVDFYISFGNPAELDAAYVYARTAARVANELLNNR